MKIPRSGPVDSQPYLFMANMFMPFIVWDTSRRTIVEKMTTAERRAIAKRSTTILRENLPEIMQGFAGYHGARTKYAEAKLATLIDKEGLLSTSESVKTAKQLDIADKALTEVDVVTQEYSTQAGYRAACLALLIPDSARREEASGSFDQLHALCESQQTIFQGLLLQDLLRLSRKYVHSYTTFDFDSLNELHINKFKKRISRLRTMLESSSASLGGINAAQFMENMRARNPVFTDSSLNDPVIGLTSEFEVLMTCFEKMNLTLSATIARCIEADQSGSGDWSLNLLAVD